MFPITITLHDAAQLNAVMQALGQASAVPQPQAAQAPTSAATPAKPVRTQPTAEAAAATAAPEKTAAASTPTAASAEAEPQASTAATDTPAVDFDTVKKAFLALSTKPDGRSKCEGVLKPYGLGKLSEGKPEQYAAILADIQKASV